MVNLCFDIFFVQFKQEYGSFFSVFVFFVYSFFSWYVHDLVASCYFSTMTFAGDMGVLALLDYIVFFFWWLVCFYSKWSTGDLFMLIWPY